MSRHPLPKTLPHALPRTSPHAQPHRWPCTRPRPRGPRRNPAPALAWIGGALLLLALGAARAGESRPPAPAAAVPPVAVLPVQPADRQADPSAAQQYAQECAACHIAYPPGLLPAASWRRVLDGLPHHHGTDASLDPATARAIGDWLAAHAATGRRARDTPPEDRITRSAWFLREHHEVAAAVWKRPAIQSPANCQACHAQAAQGDFDEHHVQIPR